MSRRDPRRGKGSKHVQLAEWFQALPAWATLKPGPRALYIELKRRYNGGNNGNIRMAIREAADLLNMHRNTVGGYFDELQERRLIRETRRGHLGAEGHGIASTWALSELPTAEGKPPDLSFRSWQPNQNPVTKSGRSCHSSCAPAADLSAVSEGPSQ
ncbi:hypothetical protein [Citreimonas salinaria]|uniref:Helix-turn-helix domain-containing protein n=1 Tax=Citreimonas salinaria TaxID=321339 RepID=A0A1H3KPA9_9RHOB|nr:hypothetical protein [Citreimonas salinaria]SDY53886.1 hypothetical protein SAMN05444340_11021 [Citreimonas salinaria]